MRARIEGNDVGYGTIAASGPHACILHWTHNDGAVSEGGELLLLDAGVEATRSTPRTSRARCRSAAASRDEQREVYDARAGRAGGGLRRLRAGQRLPRPQPRRDGGPREAVSSGWAS